MQTFAKSTRDGLADLCNDTLVSIAKPSNGGALQSNTCKALHLALRSSTVLYMPKTTSARVSELDHEPEAVVYARDKAGLRQAEAARLLGCSGPYLSQIESGVRNAGPAMLNKMAAVYNCPRVVLERKRWAA